MKTINTLLVLFVVGALVQCKSTQSPDTPAASLLNTYWRLAEMNGEPVQTPANVREAHIILSQEDQENRLKGFAGCNTIGGTFKQDGKNLTFSAFSTKMMCPENQMKVENFLLTALSTADNYEIKGETLSLLEGETTLATFQAVYLK